MLYSSCTYIYVLLFSVCGGLEDDDDDVGLNFLRCWADLLGSVEEELNRGCTYHWGGGGGGGEGRRRGDTSFWWIYLWRNLWTLHLLYIPLGWGGGGEEEGGHIFSVDLPLEEFMDLAFTCKPVEILVPFEEFMYLAFTCKPVENYHRLFRYLSRNLCTLHLLVSQLRITPGYSGTFRGIYVPCIYL